MWIVDGADPIDQAALGKPVSGTPDTLGAANPGWTLTDGIWSRVGTGVDSFVLTPAPVALAAGVWEARARVNVDQAASLAFAVTATGTLGEALGETAPGDAVPASEWGTVVQTWTAPFNAATGSIALTVTAPVGAVIQVTDPAWAPHATGTPIVEVSAELDAHQTVPGDRIDVSAESIVAGAPGGARVEIGGPGLRAYNDAGIETARIEGGEGVFVGGEFRTSDSLPGQVAISDTALSLSTGSSPGIGIEPVNAIGYTTFPGIGPGYGGMVLSGGADANGSSGMVFHPTQVQTWNTGADESYAQSYVTEKGVGMERVDAAGREIAKLYVGQEGIDLRGWANGVTYQMSLDGQGLRVGTSETSILEWLDLLTIKSRLEAIEARIAALEA